MSASNRQRQDLLSRSSRLEMPKFSSQIDRHIGSETEFLLVDDVGCEVFSDGHVKLHRDCVALLTEDALWLLRAGGLTGAKKPFEIPLGQIERVGVTRQFNVSIHYRSKVGMPESWKLILAGGQSHADLWADTTTTAVQRRLDPQAGGSERAFFERLHQFVDDLRPLAREELLGTPFAEGHGLEQAMARIPARLLGPDDVRACGRVMIVDLVVGARDEQAGSETIAIMGAAQDGPARMIAEAAIQLLREFDEEGSMLDLWLRRDDVAAEMLCWHTIARLRMATAGRMEPVERPDW